MHVHDLLQKFRVKQCIKYDRINIPLKYLLCKSKIFLETILDIAEEISKKIILDYTNLSNTLEELLSLNCITMKDLQYLLGRLFDLYIKKMMKNSTRYYRKDRDRITGVLHLYWHIKRDTKAVFTLS